MTGGQASVAQATAAVFVDGRRTGSAVLVDPRYLVTARHVLQRLDPGTGATVLADQVEVEFPGRGLGMSVVLGIVRGPKGAILVNSAKGRGTTIRVLLPAWRQRTT